MIRVSQNVTTGRKVQKKDRQIKLIQPGVVSQIEKIDRAPKLKSYV